MLVGAAFALGLFLFLGWSFSRFDPGSHGRSPSQWLLPVQMMNLYLPLLALRSRVEKAERGRTALSRTTDLLSAASFLILAGVFGLWAWKSSAGHFPFRPYRPLAFTGVALQVVAVAIRFFQVGRQRRLGNASF